MWTSTGLGVAGLFGLLLAVGGAQQPAAGPTAGLWHLLPADTDEEEIPQHRLDIRLYPTPAPFRAAIVNRNTNEDMPYAAVEFDGQTLRLGSDAPGRGPEARIWLNLTWDGVKFTGGFFDAQGKAMPGPNQPKLVRSAK